MTKEQIEQASGRELDALVAKRVFGWFVNADGFWETPGGSLYMPEHLRPYSRDGNAMLSVLEKMRERGFVTVIEQQGANQPGWHTDVYRVGTIIYRATEDSLPTAVCRAALLAVLAKEEAP